MLRSLGFLQPRRSSRDGDIADEEEETSEPVTVPPAPGPVGVTPEVDAA